MPDLDTGEREARVQEPVRFILSTTAIEVLCLLLSALVLIWSPQLIRNRRGVAILMGAFVISMVAFRMRAFSAHSRGARLSRPQQTRAKLAVESITLVAYITGLLWFTGKTASPLFNLYLLPIILSALTLGRVFTLLQVLLVCTFHGLLASSDPNVNLFSLAYAGQVVGEVAPFLLVAYFTTALSDDISEARQNLENLAQTDALTGALNLRAFNRIWQRQHRLIEGHKGHYSLLTIDIDKLKSINDTYGQDAGDSAIVLVSQCAQRGIRTTDHLGRISGDEFAVLLPGASAETADVVSNRIRNNVDNTTLDLRVRMIRCSVSIGVANYPKDARDMRELTNLSERRMYRDKALRRPPEAL